MLLRNGGVLLFPVKVTRLIKIFGFSISILSFQENFLKRYFKTKNHIYFLKKKKKKAFSLANESKNNVPSKYPRKKENNF